MSSYRNMVLIPVQEYQNLRKQILYQQGPELTKDLYQVKDSTSHLPTDERIILEGEVLRQHIKPNDIPPPIPIATPTVEQDDSIIVNNLDRFGKVNKLRSNQIYQHLKRHKIQWNELGQLKSSVDDTPIANSNIIELIDYITNVKRTKTIPAGFDEFIKIMEESQLPRNYLSTVGVTKVADYKQLQNLDDPQSIPNEWIEITPKRKRKI